MTSEHIEPSREQRVNEVIAAFLEAERVGQAPHRREWLAAHPELAVELESFLANRDRFREAVVPLGLAAAVPDPNVTLAPRERCVEPGTTVRYFGDYELVEEIARGGPGSTVGNNSWGNCSCAPVA